MKYFVYIAGLRGPEPQKWSDDFTVNGKPVPTLAKYEISEDDFYGISLNQLMLLHPYNEAKE